MDGQTYEQTDESNFTGCCSTNTERPKIEKLLLLLDLVKSYGVGVVVINYLGTSLSGKQYSVITLQKL